MENALKLNINWLVRTTSTKDGWRMRGSIEWNCGGVPTGWIGYTADMRDTESACLELHYTLKRGDEQRTMRQRVVLMHSQPHYGGRRWWMKCPTNGSRVLKLYMPPGGDCFASRKAWGLAYHSQRITPDERPFLASCRIQARMGGPEGFEAGLAHKPKGMWQRTHDRLRERYWVLDEQCSAIMNDYMQRSGLR